MVLSRATAPARMPSIISIVARPTNNAVSTYWSASAPSVSSDVDQRDHTQCADRHVAHPLAARGFRRRPADILQLAPTEVEPHHADQHADSRRAEYVLVGGCGVGAKQRGRQPAGNDRCNERTHVDAHVKDRETRVAALIGYRIQLANHGRDVRFEQAVADDDRSETELEQHRVRHHDHEQAGGHERCSDQNRALVADDLVGDVATEDRAGIYQREIGAVGEVGVGLSGLITTVELRHDVEHQGPANAVERETLPEFRHEQHPERTGVAHDLLELRDQVPVWRVRGFAHAVSPGGVGKSPLDVTAGCACVKARTERINALSLESKAYCKTFSRISTQFAPGSCKCGHLQPDSPRQFRYFTIFQAHYGFLPERCIAAVNAAKKRSSSLKPFHNDRLYDTTTFATFNRLLEGLRMAVSRYKRVNRMSFALRRRAVLR